MDFPKSGYSYLAHDGIADFAAPSADYSPSYSWVWNDVITEEEIVRQLDSMLERGIRSIYILAEPKEFRPTTMPTQLEPDYLSDEFFRLVRFATLEARKRGMCTWMYDEGGWPSGGANGLVMKLHPELAAKEITPEGEVKEVPRRELDYPGLLNPAATQAFIDLTHEGYAKAMGDDFAAYMPIAFTDEPALHTEPGTLPWIEGMEERFEERYGYALRDHLDALFNLELKDDIAHKVRADYHDLIGEMFAESYYLPLRKWCREHGILSAGHASGDDVAIGSVKYSYHHILRCLRSFDVPGVDAIWRQLFPGPEEPGHESYAPRCANRLFPRYASSAAHQIGARLSLTESYAIYGNGLTYDQMRWIFFFQAVRGINILNPMSMSYSYRGAMACSCGRPTYTEALPGAADLKVFNDYIARVCYLLSAGSPVAEQALYMPFRDIWKDGEAGLAAAEGFEKAGAYLDANQVSYDVCDDDCIQAAKIENGALVIGDARYHTVYLPENVKIPSLVWAKLDAFRKAGGLIETVWKNCVLEPLVKTDCGDIRAISRETADGTLYFLTNEALNPIHAAVSFPKESAAVAFELDLMTGGKKPVCVSPFEADYAFGDAKALLFCKEAEDMEPETDAVPAETVADIRNWTFRRTAQMTIDAEGYHKIPVEETPLSIICGDWRARTGSDFSGDAEYTAEFDAPEGLTDCVLDLGDVKYSCEPFLNGVSLGKLIFTPYTVRLPALKAHNTLTVRVSNTGANAVIAHDFSREYEAWQRGPYDFIERQFETESLRSGLYGPVRVRRTEKV